jgi:hypothetical protein
MRTAKPRFFRERPVLQPACDLGVGPAGLSRNAERSEQMGRAYEAAKKAAPTRPHPSTPNTPVANILAGPFAAVVDRARDAVRDAVKSTS